MLTNPPAGLNFNTLFDLAEEAMLLIDNNGLVLMANPAARNLLDYSEEQIGGLKVEALIPKRFRDQHHHYREAFTRKPKSRTMAQGQSLAALKRDGTELGVNIGLRPINTGNKTYTLASLYVTDRRIEAEDALRITEERLMLAKQASGLGVFDFDSNHNILHWDENMRELWGAESEKQMTNERFATYIHPDDRDARYDALDRAINPASQGEYRADYRVITPSNNSERWVSAIGRMHFENGLATRLVGVARDITEQKLAENKLNKHRVESETISQQLVAVHTASAIAHELNQPLAAISAYSEVALRSLQSKTINFIELNRALQGCVKQAQRAGTSLHELIAFLQKGELVTEEFDFNEAVKEMLSIAKGNGYGKFVPILQLEQNMPMVLGNKTQILKVLSNLLRNAVEAMQNSRTPTSTVTITISTQSDKHMAHLTLEDNGPGFAPETAHRIFEPFFTTKRSGIGMGLTISRSLVDANGGQLWIDPNSELGTKFHLTLPFAT